MKFEKVVQDLVERPKARFLSLDEYSTYEVKYLEGKDYALQYPDAKEIDLSDYPCLEEFEYLNLFFERALNPSSQYPREVSEATLDYTWRLSELLNMNFPKCKRAIIPLFNSFPLLHIALLIVGDDWYASIELSLSEYDY